MMLSAFNRLAWDEKIPPPRAFIGGEEPGKPMRSSPPTKAGSATRK
jgi:hypothetical protein